MSSSRPVKPYALALVTFGLALLLGWQATRWSVWTVNLKSETGGILKWYVDTGNGFSEEEGGYVSVPPGRRVSVEVPLATGGMKRMRLDPVDSEGPVRIFSIRWNAPWPEQGGWKDPRSARWEGADPIEREEGLILVANRLPADIRGIWEQAPGLPERTWWFIRIGFAVILAVLVFLAGWSWNLWVINTKRFKS